MSSSLVRPSLTRFEVALFPVQAFNDCELPGFFITRRVSEGQMREDVASDVTPSLAYASGCDYCEKRNFKAHASGWDDLERPSKKNRTAIRIAMPLVT
jgi:hypothetical protein